MQIQSVSEYPRTVPTSDTLPVLVYDEDGLVHAHAIELDLLATGDTDAEALAALSRVVLAQYAAAEYYGNPTLVPFPAEPEIVRRHAQARDRLLQRLPPQGDRTASLPLPSEQAIRAYAANLAPCRDP